MLICEASSKIIPQNQKIEYLWCLHCQRAFPETETKIERFNYCGKPVELRLCAYDDCDGGECDFWPWEDIRKLNHEYPEIPQLGIIYTEY